MQDTGPRQKIIDYAQRLVDDNPGNLENPTGYIQHLETTYNIALKLAIKADEKYVKTHTQIPNFNPQLIAIVGGLHDIGRPLHKDQMFHELRGADHLVELNGELFDRGIELLAARLIRSHGSVYERWQHPENEGWTAQYPDVEPSMLLPSTWAAQIITIADYSNKSGKLVDVRKRLTSSGRERALGILDRVEALTEGSLSIEEFNRYGFI